MDAVEPKKSKKEHFVEHAISIFKVVLYFFCCLIILQTFRCATLLVVDNKNEFLASYATAIVTALILGKAVFILDRIHITRMLDHKPVFIAVLYKTIFFTIATDGILSLEHFIKHHEFSLFDPHKAPIQYFVCFFAHQLALFISFALFFSAREVDSVLGGGKLAKLFFGIREELPKILHLSHHASSTENKHAETTMDKLQQIPVAPTELQTEQNSTKTSV